MRKTTRVKLISFLLILTAVTGLFSACSLKKDKEPVSELNKTVSTLISPGWIIGPSIEAQSIEPLVRADYNSITRHYDISYADCFKIKQNGKYGIIDYNGKIVVEAKYDSIVAIRNSEDFLAVRVDGDGEKSQTYINYKDFSTEPAYKTYNSLRYEYLWNSDENTAVFIQNDGGEIYQDDLKPSVPEAVRGVKDVDGKYVSDGTYGLYINGKNVMGMIYSGAGAFSNGIAALKSNGIWGYIDSNGKTVIPFGCNAVKGYSVFGGEDTPYESYDGYVTVTKDGKFGIFRNDGKPVTEMIYEGATPVVRGRAYILKAGKWGLASFGDSESADSRTERTTEKTTVPTTVKVTEKTTERTTEMTTESTTASGGETYIVNIESLNFRADSSIESDVISEIPEGTELTVDRVYEGWGHTYYGGNEGWVSLDYLYRE